MVVAAFIYFSKGLQFSAIRPAIRFFPWYENMEAGLLGLARPAAPPRLRECCRVQLLEFTGLNTNGYGIPQHFIKQFVTEITFVV